MTKRVSLLLILSFVIILGGCAFGGDHPVRPATRPTMDRYIEMMRQPESRAKKAEKSALLEELVQAVKVDPVRARRAVGMITDDQGTPLDGVTVIVSRRENRTPASPDLSPRREEILVNREFDVPMKSFPNMALTFVKEGYADAGWGFGEEGEWKAYHTGGAERWLERPSYVVPRPDGRPGVHVVMRPAKYEWIPTSDSDFFHPNKKYWPNEAPADAPILISSDAPQLIAVPETGTYVITNRLGRVVLLLRLRRGMHIGFDKEVYLGQSIWAWHVGGSSGYPVAEGPCAWRLYSVAKPVYPTTAKTDVKTGE